MSDAKPGLTVVCEGRPLRVVNWAAWQRWPLQWRLRAKRLAVGKVKAVPGMAREV